MPHSGGLTIAAPERARPHPSGGQRARRAIRRVGRSSALLLGRVVGQTHSRPLTRPAARASVAGERSLTLMPAETFGPKAPTPRDTTKGMLEHLLRAEAPGFRAVLLV